MKYKRKHFEKIRTAPLWRYGYDVGVLRGIVMQFLMIKYNEDYSTKLFKTSLVDKIYDSESYHVLTLIFKKLFAPESNVVYVFFEWPSYVRKKRKYIKK